MHRVLFLMLSKNHPGGQKGTAEVRGRGDVCVRKRRGLLLHSGDPWGHIQLAQTRSTCNRLALVFTANRQLRIRAAGGKNSDIGQ